MFPTGQKRRDLVARKQQAIVAYAKNGFTADYFSWTDSKLDIGFGNFGSTFYELLPHSKEAAYFKISIREYVEKVLAEKKGKAIGVEFGGPGSGAFAGFTPGFFLKSAGVTLFDQRADGQDGLDKKNNHAVFIGDIISLEVYRDLAKWLKGQKADFILERMAKGLDLIPWEPYLIGAIFSVWYSFLNQNGLMLVQVPVVFNDLVSCWTKTVRGDYSGTLEIKFVEGKDNSRDPCSVLLVRKLANAPKKLFLLKPKTVREISLKNSYVF